MEHEKEERGDKREEKKEHMGGKRMSHSGGKHHSAHKSGMGKKEIGFSGKLPHQMGKASHIEGPSKR